MAHAKLQTGVCVMCVFFHTFFCWLCVLGTLAQSTCLCIGFAYESAERTYTHVLVDDVFFTVCVLYICLLLRSCMVVGPG